MGECTEDWDLVINVWQITWLLIFIVAFVLRMYAMSVIVLFVMTLGFIYLNEKYKFKAIKCATENFIKNKYVNNIKGVEDEV